MMYHVNQNFTADAKMYHTFMYVEHTWSYDHICAQFWGSVSSSRHGNTILKHLTRPTRVWIRPAPSPQMSTLLRSNCIWLKLILNLQVVYVHQNLASLVSLDDCFQGWNQTDHEISLKFSDRRYFLTFILTNSWKITCHYDSWKWNICLSWQRTQGQN